MNDFSFTAIDFETANYGRNSICQVGLVRVEDGEITDEVSRLVQPPENRYHPFFPGIHNIYPSMTERSPFFGKIWASIEPYFRDETVVAHNMAFDGACLRAALVDSSIEPVPYKSECTYRIFGRGLKSLCDEFSIPLDHHDALSDARACAQLYMIHLNRPTNRKINK